MNSEIRQCNIVGASAGASTIWPPLEARCARGPGKQCVVTPNPTEVWEVSFPPDDPAWRDWGEIGYRVPKRTHFHRWFEWALVDGICSFTSTMYGDLDDDDVYSTYEVTERFAPGTDIVDHSYREKNDE